ncbi:Histidine triad (HIT) family protein [Paenibacillus typhae]|uniref:Histidine triad (HIT) family protein n=1 Tax=Paenibacillus typhae TaxID=1174501 RepID=A0A1G8J028_9BACL|nr:histidine triad (HIT) family protein [Paenibacillus typhae]
MLRCKNSCIENIYSLTGELSGRINRLEIKVSKALKETYGCDGSSSRQNNERHTAGMCGSTILHVFRAMTRTSCTHQDPE